MNYTTHDSTVKLCECGCNQSIPIETKTRKHQALPRFIKGHNLRVRKLAKATCQQCGVEFHPFYAKQPYCSVDCYEPNRGNSRKNRETKTCEVCGVLFDVAKYRAEKAKWCSKECWSSRRKPNLKACDTCGNQFDAIDNRTRFCSHECLISWKSGETSPAWKGGKAAHRLRTQYKGALAVWRKAVYKRDNYTCQGCGAKNNIQAHHIKPVSEYPELGLDIDNGKTLCITCHGIAHGRKLRLTSKYPKHCKDCGSKTLGRTLRCQSCSQKYSWSEGRRSHSKRKGSIPVA